MTLLHLVLQTLASSVPLRDRFHEEIPPGQSPWPYVGMWFLFFLVLWTCSLFLLPLVFPLVLSRMAQNAQRKASARTEASQEEQEQPLLGSPFTETPPSQCNRFYLYVYGKTACELPTAQRRMAFSLIKGIHNNLVSFVHAVAAVQFAFRSVSSPAPAVVTDKFYGYSAFNQWWFAFSAGYFLFDLCNELVHVNFIMVAHAGCSLFVYTAIFHPFLHWFGPYFILFELSTPFYNIRFMLAQLGMKHTTVAWLNERLFFVAFAGARIGMGLPLSVYFWVEMIGFLHDNRQYSVIVCLAYLLCNFVLNILNLKWFTVMIQLLLCPPSKEKDDKLIVQ